MIAGVVGAVANNQEGIAGINWNVKIMSVRMLDGAGIGDSNEAREAVEYAIANGADVINLSFTGFDHDPFFEGAAKKAFEQGVIIVAAVGNSEGGINVDDQPIYPACYGEGKGKDYVLGVAATDFLDVRTSFSNFGSSCVDIAAPGDQIFGTYQDDSASDFTDAFYQGGWSGTSMASPMVAGAAALLRGAYPSLTPTEMKTVLQLSVDAVKATGEAKGKMGAGRLNIEKALALRPLQRRSRDQKQNHQVKKLCLPRHIALSLHQNLEARLSCGYSKTPEKRFIRSSRTMKRSPAECVLRWGM